MAASSKRNSLDKLEKKWLIELEEYFAKRRCIGSNKPTYNGLKMEKETLNSFIHGLNNKKGRTGFIK